MSVPEISEKPLNALLDTEAYTMLRMMEPRARDSTDYESYVKARMAKEQWRRERAGKRFRGVAYDLQTPNAPPSVGDDGVGRRGGLMPPAGMGAAMPPNISGGFGFSALLPLLPGLIGGVASAIPGIIGLFKKGKGAEYGGSVMPPNLRRGGLATDALRAIIPAAERIERDVSGAKSGAEFFHKLATGLRGEIGPLLHRYSRVAPEHVDFITTRVLKKMGLPPSFVDFVADEAARIAEKGTSAAARRLSGSGVSGGAAIKELVRPIVKYLASKALHKVGPARALYKKAKSVMDSASDIWDYTEPPKAAGGRAPRKPPVAAAAERALEEEEIEEEEEAPKKKGIFGRIGDIARRVVGKTLETIAPAGSKALGVALDVAANRVLGTSSTLGREIAESLGQSALQSVGKAMQDDDESPEEEEEVVEKVRRPPPARKGRPKVAVPKPPRARKYPSEPAPAPTPRTRTKTGARKGRGASAERGKKSARAVIRVL